MYFTWWSTIISPRSLNQNDYLYLLLWRHFLKKLSVQLAEVSNWTCVFPSLFQERNNLTNVSSFRYSGLVHRKTLAVVPADKTGFTVIYKKKSHAVNSLFVCFINPVYYQSDVIWYWESTWWLHSSPIISWCRYTNTEWTMQSQDTFN